MPGRQVSLGKSFGVCFTGPVFTPQYSQSWIPPLAWGLMISQATCSALTPSFVLG